MQFTATLAMRMERSPIQTCQRREEARVQVSGADERMSTSLRTLQIMGADSGAVRLRSAMEPQRA